MTDQDAPLPPMNIAPPAPAPVLVPGKRTMLAAAAGVILLILGILGIIVAVAILTIGRGILDNFDFSNLPGMSDIKDPGGFISSVFSFVGILLVIFSAFYVIGGVGAMRTAGWARVMGIVIGIVGTLFWLPAIAASGQVGDSNPGIAYVLLGLHAYVFVVLAFFWRAKPSVA